MKKIAGTLVLLTLLALAVYIASTRGTSPRSLAPTPAPTPAAGTAATHAGVAAPTDAPPPGDEPRPAALEPEYYPPLAELNRPGRPVQADLRILSEMFHHYQMLVKDPSGNPVGDNAEIVRALQGRNRAALAFMPTNHPALNERGELVDRWGTPFFFHALSGHSMEVRSAGPDRRLWNEDDAVFPQPRAKPAPGR